MSKLIKLRDPYQPETCPHCNQTTTYLLPIDCGTVDILRAVARAIRVKGINIIHPRKEMEVDEKKYQCYDHMIANGKMTSNMVGNLSRPRFHGLIAHVKGEPGNYCLTSKGARFLKGDIVARFAIISKKDGHQIGYYMPEEYFVKIDDFKRSEDEYWEGIDFDIVDGRIVKDLEKKSEPEKVPQPQLI